jgi:hypothetical protein
MFSEGVGENEYNLIPEIWSAKSATLSYLEGDLNTLLEVVTLHALSVLKTFGVSIFNTLTVPSLAMKVYRANYLSNEIAVINGSTDLDMRNGYYGGIVAAIKPEIKDGYYYDVNSAYPAAMKMDMPVGQPTLKAVSTLNGVFGMVKARVISPDYTVNNILPLPMRDERGVPVFRHGMESTGF